MKLTATAPDGTIVTRTTKNSYTHVVIARPDSPEVTAEREAIAATLTNESYAAWYRKETVNRTKSRAWSWHSRLDLAQRVVATNPDCDLVIVEVNA